MGSVTCAHFLIFPRLMCLILGSLTGHEGHRQSHTEQQNDISYIFLFRIHFSQN